MPDLLSEGVAQASRLDAATRITEIHNARQAYLGKTQSPLLVKRGAVDDNIRLNFTKMVVNKGVSFLFGKEFSLSIDGDDVDDDAQPDADDGDAAADQADAATDPEEYLEATLAANKGMATFQKLALNGALAGSPFLKVLAPDPDGNGHPYPRLVVLDPATVRPIPDDDDVDRVIAYEISYPMRMPSGDLATFRQMIEPTTYVMPADGSEAYDAALMPPDQAVADEDGVAKGWRILDQVSRDGTAWVTVDRQLWPYPWAPIFHCQNAINPDDVWGFPDVDADLLALNRAVNFIASNINRILRFHAHPKTWGKGFQADQLRIAVDETIVLPSPTSELANLEMSSDLGSSLAFYREMVSALHVIQQIPEVASGKLNDIGAISGLALQILFLPLVEKTEAKRLTYGQMVVDLGARLLELGGFGPGIRPQIAWPEIVPDDPMGLRQALVLDEQLGVSQRTILEKLGYDPDVEKQRRQEEAADAQAQAQAAAKAFDAGAAMPGATGDQGGDPSARNSGQ